MSDEQGKPKEWPAGADLMEADNCPRSEINLMACWLCPVGHATECHWPYTCEDARCSYLTIKDDLDAYPD